MPVARADENPIFQLGGNRITGLVSPSRGSSECILYRIDVPGGGRLPAHRHDHEDAFTLLAGSGNVHIDEASHEIGAGDSVVVPTGALHWVEAGPEGCTMIVTMLAGTLFIREDGASVPPWGK
jgi:quercetin dioxygenase-like cupin family protein